MTVLLADAMQALCVTLLVFGEILVHVIHIRNDKLTDIACTNYAET